MRKTLKKWFTLAVAALLSVVLVLAIALPLAACGGGSDGWHDGTWEYTDQNGNAAVYYYSLYVPKAYTKDNSKSLPLITYIPDSSYVSSAANGSEVSLGWTKEAEINGWITDENMSGDNAAFILVFGTTSGYDFTDEGNTEGDQALKIMDYVMEEYNMDTTRQYLTGQSMGGIADFFLNDKYPDRFAATVYVGCQPGGTARSETDPNYYRIIENRVWEKQKFVYICSRMDGQAPYGQDDMIAVLEEDGLSYGGATDALFSLDHEDLETTNALVKAELEKGYNMNFFGFKQLTRNGAGDAEHMASFEYCYSLQCIYDWLLAQ